MDKKQDVVPSISEAEWKIMRVLWGNSEHMPAYDIVQAVADQQGWHPRTVKTLLHRLVKKGVLGYRRYKNLYLYYPLLAEAACLQAESRSFLQRCFGGNLRPMLVHFIEQQDLTQAQIRDLKKILDEKGK